MGRIRTAFTKRLVNELIYKQKEKFNDNFDQNKIKIKE